MSVVTKHSSENRVILHDVSWETYESLVRDLEDRCHARVAFDEGILEIVTPSAQHERPNWLLARIVEIALQEMDRDFENLGSTTFQRKSRKRGFEPDSCFYLHNIDRIRNKKRLNLEIDPPPDLVIEIDVTRDSLNKLPIYAALQIPEVWRYQDSLEIMSLEDGRYLNRTASLVLPILTTLNVTDLLEASTTISRPQWLREVHASVCRLLENEGPPSRGGPQP